MSTTILRTPEAWWVRTATGASRIDTQARTTRELLSEREAIEKAAAAEESVGVEHLDLISPITAPCRVVAQMTNFTSHVKDAGMDPASTPLAFFRKASGSISGPYDDIIRPHHVRFLDYEVEVGLVIGSPIPVGTDVTQHNLSSFVAGLVATNDVSARDVQLPKTQFYESKSYPTFTPAGPALLLLDHGDLERFADLRLRLWVNSELRQDAAIAGDMIYGPLQALQALSRFQRLDPGDLLLTGTPVGTALSAPPKPMQIIANLLPPATKWKLFFKRHSANPKYLRPGDVIEIAISTDDGTLDLGRQRTVVRAATS